MAFDFSIEYKKGNENKAADALFRNEEAKLLDISLLSPNDPLYAQIKEIWSSDAALHELITKLQVQPFRSYTWINYQLRWKGRLVVGADHQLRQSIIRLWHSTPQGGHSGMDATIKRLKSLFFWKTLSQDIREFINKCDICQRHKYDASTYPGLLQPLPIPGGVWTDICLDFIEGLPKSNGKEKPPIYLPYLVGEAVTDMVDRSLAAREAIIQLLKFHLARAQQKMKDMTNNRRFDRSFVVGDWIYLKLQSYRKISVASRLFNKLAAKYFGPFPITAKVGAVAYRLLLPTDVLIHPTFHMSQLKKCHEVPATISHPHVLHLSSPYYLEPEGILSRRLVKKGNKAACQVLVKWSGVDAAQATWEYLTDLQHRFPSFTLEGKGVLD
ncbi:uncharacterized protein [Nicotiana sylvestris]|uniref:uncharacterized protein n=1 Tax=Nicotiana sylvestris TaxID=4096 RepID=UPI00388CEBD6